MKKPWAKFAIPIVATLALLGSPIVAQPLDAKLFAERNSFVALASQVTSSAGPESQQLGFRGSDLTDELASRLGVEARQGVVMLEVRPGGRADRAGLRRGDVILEIDGQAVPGFAQFERLASASKEPVALLVARGEQQRLLAL